MFLPLRITVLRDPLFSQKPDPGYLITTSRIFLIFLTEEEELHLVIGSPDIQGYNSYEEKKKILSRYQGLCCGKGKVQVSVSSEAQKDRPGGKSIKFEMQCSPYNEEVCVIHQHRFSTELLMHRLVEIANYFNCCASAVCKTSCHA